MPKLSHDGRGGWVFSQAAADRYISDYEHYYIVFGLAVLADNAIADDYVESTRLTARMKDRVLGVDEMKWHQPNTMWGFHDGKAIFEWSQRVAPVVTEDGMIECDIDIKFHSQNEYVRVSQPAYCHITRVSDSSSQCGNQRFESSIRFTLSSLFRKPRWSVPPNP